MDVLEQIKTLKPYQPGKTIESVKKEYGLEKVVKLASNENPYGCSKKAIEAIQNSLHELAIYPDGYATELRKAVAKKLGVNEESLVFGNGSDEVIEILSRSILQKGDNIVTAWPTFSQYRHNATVEGAEIIEVPLKDGVHDLNEMAKAINEKTKIIWVCNPNNPSGTYVTNEELVQFLKQVPSHVLVVLDEAYKEYVVAEDFPDSIALLKDFSNLMVLRTFSKAYGLAALRVGFGVGNETLVTRLNAVREPFNNVRMSQFAATAALSDEAFIEQCRIKNRAGLDKFYAFCKENGLKYYPSQTNFILIDMEKQGDEVFEALLKQGYIVRSGEALGFPTCVRITVGTEEEVDGVIASLKQLL